MRRCQRRQRESESAVARGVHWRQGDTYTRCSLFAGAAVPQQPHAQAQPQCPPRPPPAACRRPLTARLPASPWPRWHCWSHCPAPQQPWQVQGGAPCGRRPPPRAPPLPRPRQRLRSATAATRPPPARCWAVAPAPRHPPSSTAAAARAPGAWTAAAPPAAARRAPAASTRRLPWTAASLTLWGPTRSGRAFTQAVLASGRMLAGAGSLQNKAACPPQCLLPSHHQRCALPRTHCAGTDSAAIAIEGELQLLTPTLRTLQEALAGPEPGASAVARATTGVRPAAAHGSCRWRCLRLAGGLLGAPPTPRAPLPMQGWQRLMCGEPQLGQDATPRPWPAADRWRRLPSVASPVPQQCCSKVARHLAGAPRGGGLRHARPCGSALGAQLACRTPTGCLCPCPCPLQALRRASRPPRTLLAAWTAPCRQAARLRGVAAARLSRRCTQPPCTALQCASPLL